MPIPWRQVLAAVTAVAVAGVASAADGEAPAQRDIKPVVQRIDQEIQKKLDEAKLKPSPRTDDAEFLRRAYLDITGKIPSADKARAFLDSQEADKRAKLIDELLASPDYGRHFAIIWRTMLVKRDEANRTLNSRGFQDWLTEQFNQNPGWHKTVQAMLTAEGETDKNPAGFFFLANRDMTRLDPAKITGTTFNLFLGVQMQCAECHNHPFVSEWKQSDFWGLAAFFGRVRDTATPARANQPPATANIAETAATASKTGKRPGGGFGGRPMPTGATIAIPSATDPNKVVGSAKAKFFEGEEPKLGSQPPYRPAVAEWLTSAENKYFAKAAVNRMWAHLLGRGFVNPVEDMNHDNEPSHPELLQALAKEFGASGFDLKHLIRCICNSETYQRSSAPIAENKDDDKLFSHQTVKVMSAESLYDSLTAAMGSEPSVGGGGGRPGGGGQRGFAGGAREQFVRFFDTREEGDDASDSGHGIPQFLRLMNSAQLNRTTTLVNRLAKEGLSHDKAIEAMYLSTLSRRPTPTEAEKLGAYVAKQADPKKGYDGVMWILLNSAEFMCIR
ncbi:MAG: DUF1553 domain-containing protein [Planctomycetia bacterium]|nr:DUF1553 domain-containing protein [Planctomycetia bacterium]